MEWDLKLRDRFCPLQCLLFEGEGHRKSGQYRLSWAGLFCVDLILSTVWWVTMFSALSGVHGSVTGMTWTEESALATNSLQFTGTTEAWDPLFANDLDRSSVMSDTQTTICHAQCTAKCCDNELIIPPVLTDDSGEENTTTGSPEVSCVTHCDRFTNDDWINDCDRLICVWNCGDSSLKSGPDFWPDPPYNLSLQQLTSTLVYLEWQHDELITRHSVLYVLERTVDQDTWQSVNVTSNTYYTTTVGVCEESHFQVASVNQFGHNGYSTAVTRSELPRPGPVRQLELLEEPVYHKQFFHFLYSFYPPKGWNFHDVKVSPVFLDKECSSTPVPPVPIGRIYESKKLPETYEAEISIHETGYNCNYFMGIISLSKCDVEGDTFNFTINITNCELLNYECPEIPFKWPSKVQNVSVEVLPADMEAYVTWLPAENTGSSNTISSYLIQWGLVTTVVGFQMPKLQEEGRLTVPGDQYHAVIYLNKTDTLYGIKVIGVVPIKENETDELNDQMDKMAAMETFTVKLPSTAPSVISGSSTLSEGNPHLGTSVPSHASTTTTFHLFISSSGMSPAAPNLGDSDMLPFYVSIPIIVIVIGALTAVLLTIHKKKAQNKEDLPRQVFSQLPGYNATMMKQVQNCMESNPLYDLQTRRELPSSPMGDCWEISRQYLTLGEILGRGAFGQVVKGRVKTIGLRNWRKISTSSTGSYTEDCNQDEITVAVKMLLEFAGDSHKQEFLKEMQLMKKIGHHVNVVSIIGCVTEQGPLCLIVEHVPHGDLLHYLRKHRQSIQEENSDSGIREEWPKLTIMDLLSMARQIATGMEFLSQKGFVHRDLACRNILVGKNRIVKIGDFGLTRFIYDDKIYVTKKGGKLPLKWMAIESIFDLTFTSASDVWSFGVVLFELITLGGTPYPTIANKDLLRELRGGSRMERPDNCPEELYEVMCHCWKERSKDRPSFTELRNLMDKMIQTYCTAEYMTFDINANKDYYVVGDSDSCIDEEEPFGLSTSDCDQSKKDHAASVEQVDQVTKHEVHQTSVESESTGDADLRSSGHVDVVNEEDGFKSTPVRQKNGKCGGGLSIIASPGLSLKMHSPLKVFRKEGDDLLSVSTCSTDQLLPAQSSGSTYSDSMQTSAEASYEVLTKANVVRETRF